MQALEFRAREEPLCPGAIVADRYQVLDYLGRGEAGDIYACRHLDLPDRIVASRVVDPFALSSRALSSRVWNEMQFGYLIDDPNVVRYFGHRIDGSGLVAVREYLDGGTLAELTSRVLLGTRETLSLLTKIASGLSAIHAARVVHCDLTAQNILVSRDLSDVKIKGFGSSRFESSQFGLPEPVRGVCAVVDAPEYRAEGRVDYSGDIYSFGALAHELICRTRGSGSDEPPRSLRHDCPKRLSEIVLRCLSICPDSRPQSSARLKRDLEAVTRSLTLSAIPALSVGES